MKFYNYLNENKWPKVVKIIKQVRDKDVHEDMTFIAKLDNGNIRIGLHGMGFLDGNHKELVDLAKKAKNMTDDKFVDATEKVHEIIYKKRRRK